MLNLSCKNLSQVQIDSDPAKILHLDLSNNKLSSGSSLKPFVHLNTLVLDNNLIRGLDNFPVLRQLTTISLNKNHIQDISIFLEQAVNVFGDLKNLSLLKNPCCPIFESQEKYDVYRDCIFKSFPSLLSLDGFPSDILNKHSTRVTAVKQHQECMEKLFGHSDTKKIDETVKSVKLKSQGNRFVKNQHL